MRTDVKLLPDGDLSGYVEKGNASTRRGFLFINDLGTSDTITPLLPELNALMYWDSALSNFVIFSCHSSEAAAGQL